MVATEEISKEKKLEIIKKVMSDFTNDVPLLIEYFDKLKIYERESGKWYIEGNDADKTDKMILNTTSNKSNPEEIIRQLIILELIKSYHYASDRIKTEQTITFGRDESKRADQRRYSVYQRDLSQADMP